jgi:hypothetical protein
MRNVPNLMKKRKEVERMPEAKYEMSVDELELVVAFVRNHEAEEIPQYIKELLDKWEEFLEENY